MQICRRQMTVSADQIGGLAGVLKDEEPKTREGEKE